MQRLGCLGRHVHLHHQASHTIGTDQIKNLYFVSVLHVVIKTFNGVRNTILVKVWENRPEVVYMSSQLVVLV